MTYSASGPASGLTPSSAGSSGSASQGSQANSRATTKIQRMAALCAWIVFLATIACGGTPEGEMELETGPVDLIYDEPASLDLALEVEPPEGAIPETVDKLFKYDQYGSENAGSARCIPPWGGGVCKVPSTKTRTYQVLSHDADGCWGQYWTDLIQQSINHMNSWHLAFQTGYQYVPFVAAPQQYPDLILWCDADLAEGSTTLGKFIPGAFWCSETPHGELCRYVEGLLKLAGNNLIWLCQGQGATQSQCHKMIANVIRHELGHEMGLGHTAAGVPGVLMSSAWNAAITNPRWNQLMTLTTSGSNNESSLIWGYCPTGNTAGCQ